MELKERFLKYLKFLPDLRNEYFPGDFFFNFYGENNPVRIGCRYSDANLGNEENESYLVIVEIFKEKPKIEFFDSEKNRDLEIIYGHIPKFHLMEKYLNKNCNFISVIKENKIITVINLKKSREAKDFNDLPGLYSFLDAKKDENLKKFILKFVSKNNSIKPLPIFDFIDYLPEKFGDWKLTTFFCFYLSQIIDGKNHLISNIQGNYKKDKEYLNLTLRFIYKMSEGKINIEPEGIEENFGDIKIKRKKTGNILNISYFDKKENFNVIISNNETTPEFEKYEKDIRGLLLVTLEKLSDYNCIEQTMKFIDESKKLMKT